MKGFLKMLASDFDAWNDEATAIANANGVCCGKYTYFVADTDPLYVWARIEHEFIEGDVKTKVEAVELGMVEI